MSVLAIEGISLRYSGRLVWRNGRPTVELRPWAHAPGCGCKLAETFTCDRCGRRVGFCLGCHDDMPGACDFCWHPPSDEAR